MKKINDIGGKLKKWLENIDSKAFPKVVIDDAVSLDKISLHDYVSKQFEMNKATREAIAAQQAQAVNIYPGYPKIEMDMPVYKPPKRVDFQLPLADFQKIPCGNAEKLVTALHVMARLKGEDISDCDETMIVIKGDHVLVELRESYRPVPDYFRAHYEEDSAIVKMRDQWAKQAAEQMARQIDKSILDNVKVSQGYQLMLDPKTGKVVRLDEEEVKP